MRRRGVEQESIEEEPMRESPIQYDPSPNELTVIGKGARLEGNLISAASLRIDGAVKGQVTAEGDVIVSPEADVAADVKAKNVTIAGKYAGNVTASGTLELSSTARVEGNVSCGSLIVNQGAIFAGQSIMGGSGGIAAADRNGLGAPEAANPPNQMGPGASPDRLELEQMQAIADD